MLTFLIVIGWIGVAAVGCTVLIAIVGLVTRPSGTPVVTAIFYPIHLSSRLASVQEWLVYIGLILDTLSQIAIGQFFPEYTG